MNSSVVRFQNMQQVLALAEEGLAQGELPIAAIVVLDGKIISQSTTKEKQEGRLLVHAELLALQMADKLRPFPGKRRNMQLYTNLEPCLMCLGAAMSSFVGEILYALESPGDGAVSLIQQWERDKLAFPAYQLPKIQGGICRDQSLQLFERYLEQNPPSPLTEWVIKLVDATKRK